MILLCVGGLLPNGTMNINKGEFALAEGESKDILINDPSLLIFFTPLNHNPSVSIIPAQWSNTITALFEGIIVFNNNVEGRICLLKNGNRITVINNATTARFSYLFSSVDPV